ncbi:MAG: copper resistance protein CopC [Pseudonocardiaceae bacterium]|nr:copper resistance protein CopC [Pseudonocardiaceae bacterium]
MRRLVVPVLAGLALLIGFATPAQAHNQLVDSDPKNGASVQTGPKQVTLTFDQPVQPGEFNTIAITGPKGGSWVDGPATVDGPKVRAKVRPLGPAGKYTIGYRILSADGHPVNGELAITLTKAGNGTPSKAPASQGGSAAEAPSGDDSGGAPIWVWIAGAVVLLGLGLFVAMRGGRSSSGGTSR